jgi:hypothetical protein
MKTQDLVFIPLIIGEASGVFAGFCPSWFTVSSPFFHEQDAREGNIRRIRWGEVAATLIVLSTGAAISYHTGSKLPWWVSVATCGVFVGGYEYMIQHPAKDDSGGLPEITHTALHWRNTR